MQRGVGVLRERLVRFIPEVSHLPREDQQRIVRSLLWYALGRYDSRDVRELARELGVPDELYRFKSEFLDRTYYMVSVWWRAVLAYFRHLPATSQLSTTALDVPTLLRATETVATVEPNVRRSCAADVALIEAFLTLDDHQHLYRLARALPYATPSDHDLVPIVKKLQRYCASLAYTRMRFIVEHDRALTYDDLRIELFEAGLMTLRHYDAEFSDELKLLNTAKKGAHNHCVRLIEFHTARCRSRLVRHIEQKVVPYRMRRCGTCAWFDARGADSVSCRERGMEASFRPCRAQHFGNLYHARSITGAHECANCIRYDAGRSDACVMRNVLPTARPCGSFESRVGAEQFIDTTASLDAPLGSSEKRVGGTLLDYLPATSRGDATDEWLEELLERLPADSARVVRITLGLGDAEFDDWLWYETGEPSSTFTDSVLARYACTFVGVTLDVMRDHLRQFLTERVPRSMPTKPNRRRASSSVKRFSSCDTTSNAR